VEGIKAANREVVAMAAGDMKAVNIRVADMEMVVVGVARDMVTKRL
jgi:hypothetical protein